SPAVGSLNDRGVLVDPDAAQTLGPDCDPRLDTLGWELREQVEVRDDEMAVENAESVAHGYALGEPGGVELVWGVALFTEHHRSGVSSRPDAVGTIATRARGFPTPSRISRSRSSIAGVNSPDPTRINRPRVNPCSRRPGRACRETAGTCDRSCGGSV